jgi:hypothetical protein
MKPSKLKNHSEGLHKEFVGKTVEHKRKECMLKFSRLYSTGQFARTNESVLEASSPIALRTAECRRLPKIGKALIKPCLVETM